MSEGLMSEGLMSEGQMSEGVMSEGQMSKGLTALSPVLASLELIRCYTAISSWVLSRMWWTIYPTKDVTT